RSALTGGCPLPQLSAMIRLNQRREVPFHQSSLSPCFGGNMKKSLLAGVAILGLSMFAGYSYSADDAKTEKIVGVLVDQKCGANFAKKDDPEKAAADHTAACCK